MSAGAAAWSLDQRRRCLAVLSFQAYVVQPERHVILVDTCCGNEKDLPGAPQVSNLKTNFLPALAAANVVPEQVDFVMCTHWHAASSGGYRYVAAARHRVAVASNCVDAKNVLQDNLAIKKRDRYVGGVVERGIGHFGGDNGLASFRL